MSIDFSGTEYENEDLEPLVTTSLTREDEGEYSLRPKTLREYIGQEKAKAIWRCSSRRPRCGTSRWTTSCSTAPPAGQDHSVRHHCQ